jgi:hypothetical protein
MSEDASEPLLEATDVYPLTLMAGASEARARRSTPMADA